MITEVRALERLDLEGLRTAWIERYGAPAPKVRSRELLGLVLAWRMQAATHGGLDASLMRKLRDHSAPRRAGVDVPVGAVLMREWRGAPQTVRRTPAGYEWNGKTYRSLSAVAGAISGGKWSGPAFFGLSGARGGQV